jgi:probable phosphoglycerate mutase
MGEPSLWLVRHGETEWSRALRHTSHTDLPLTGEGRAAAASLAPVLGAHAFARVYSSPLRRARETASAAGFDGRVEVLDALTEWDYGEYEGKTSAEIRRERPDWWLWRDGCPGGESPQAVYARLGRVIETEAAADGDVLCFAHGHALRVLAACWCALGVEAGARLYLAPATVSVLGHEHDTRVITRWNAPAG